MRELKDAINTLWDCIVNIPRLLLAVMLKDCINLGSMTNKIKPFFSSY